MNLTHRIPMERSLLEAVRCALGLHLWARWELGTAKTLKGKEIVVDIRESICCGHHEVRVL